jgi:hypothetical protein
MYKIKNTAMDRSKDFLHRRAPRMRPEPTISGRRLMLNQTMVLTDEQYAHNELLIKELISHGVVEVEMIPPFMIPKKEEPIVEQPVVVIEEEVLPVPEEVKEEPKESIIEIPIASAEQVTEGHGRRGRSKKNY